MAKKKKINTTWKSQKKSNLITTYHVAAHEEGSSICLLHKAFEKHGFHTSPCTAPECTCTTVGYSYCTGCNGHSLEGCLKKYNLVLNDIAEVKGLDEDRAQIAEYITEMEDTGELPPLYEPIAFKFVKVRKTQAEVDAHNKEYLARNSKVA